MKVINYPEKSCWPGLLKRPVLNIREAENIVLPILDDIRIRGDEALREYTMKFDHVNITDLRVSDEEYFEAGIMINDDLKKAIEMASHNIEVFHRSQLIKPRKIITSKGVECWQKAVPVEKIGLYVPGGTAPLFSTVLMLAVPARIAGCTEIVLCTPPQKDGKIHPAILYAAKLTGVTAVFKTGGAQAIAAMAYGTSTISKVHKIFGPGNQYVTAAKQIVARGDVAIDMPAGPSELAIIADETANATFVASDLLSQAEHGPDSQVLFVSTSEDFINIVLGELKKQLQALPRKAIASQSLQNSKAILLNNTKEVIELVNEYAPEHLIITAANEEQLAEQIINAGSVFIGSYTPESAGDYASGTNHTLPTNGFAKVYNGVNLDNYVKKITFQKVTRKGLKNIGPTIMIMAETEELMAHKNAVSIRLNYNPTRKNG
jgi:histidinol dehydrogenase